MTSATGYSYPGTGLPIRRGERTSEVAKVQQALNDGLDPNVVWGEKTLVKPKPRSGCVVPAYIPGSLTWPHYNTPLHRAMRLSDLESAELLLQHGADINQYNSVGRTPLHEAVEHREHDAVRFLLAHGANVNKSTISAHVRYEDDDRDICGEGGITNLQIAITNSDYDNILLLVEAGADLCPDSQTPWTALDLALLTGDRKVVKIFLSHGSELPVKPSLQQSDLLEDRHPNPVRRLLSVVESDQLVPPSDLYLEAYCYTLWRMENQLNQIGRDTEDDAIESLIQSLFDGLESSAGVVQSVIDTNCSSCREFQLRAARIYETKTAFEFVLHKDRESLNQSASRGCLLCGITADALDFKDQEDVLKPDGKNKALSFDDQDNAPEPKEKGEHESLNAVPVILKPRLYTSKLGGVGLTGLYVCYGELEFEMNMSWMDESWKLICGEVDNRTDSPTAIQVAKKWLRTCREDESHSACHEALRQQEEGDTTPERLLYIGKFDSELHLVERGDIKGPYCALSYCCESKPFLTTTRNNILQHMKNVPMDSLPATIRDAILMTRALGYEYLWIEALCVVQDAADDLTREFGNIGAIFSHADLTISSLASNDAHSGLFENRSHRVVRPVVLDIWKPVRNRRWSSCQVILAEWKQKHACIRGPVHRQGWKLQEQLFSTRILYFGNGTLHWECLEGYKQEADPARSYQRGYNYRVDIERNIETKLAVKGIEAKRQSFSQGSPAFNAFEYWKTQVEAFTQRDLPNLSDRLPAFASISDSFSRVAGSRSVVGIWEGDRMLESLCWKVTSPAQDFNTSLPSWTWAAVAGEISFDLVSRNSRGTGDILPRCTVVSLNIPQPGTSSRSMHGSSMKVKGRLCRKKLVDQAFFQMDEDIVIKLILQHAMSPRRPIYFDHSFDGTEALYAMDVLSFPRGPLPQGYGYPAFPHGRPPATIRLLLQRIEPGKPVFRRVGIGSALGLTGTLKVPHRGTDEDQGDEDANGKDNEAKEQSKEEEEEKEEEKEEEEEEELTPYKWLLLDEEIFEEEEITIV